MWYQDLPTRERRELTAAVRRLGAECARDYQARAHPAAPYYTMMSQRDERALVRLVQEYGVTDLDDVARIWHDAHALFTSFWMGVRDEIRRQVRDGDPGHRLLVGRTGGLLARQWAHDAAPRILRSPAAARRGGMRGV